jgi:hypothetical protein
MEGKQILKNRMNFFGGCYTFSSLPSQKEKKKKKEKKEEKEKKERKRKKKRGKEKKKEKHKFLKPIFPKFVWYNTSLPPPLHRL